jgi:hypothetical protein
MSGVLRREPTVQAHGKTPVAGISLGARVVALGDATGNLFGASVLLDVD